MNKFDLSDFVNVRTIEAVLADMISNIKRQRKELKLTQKSLAKMSGVTYSSIKRFEQTGDISLANLLKIANAMDELDCFDKLFRRTKVTNIKDL